MSKTNVQLTQRLTESAIMLLLFNVLNEFTPIELPWGGSVTLFSQLPLIVIAYRYGVKWGLLTSLTAGVFQAIFGAKNFTYVTGIVAYLIVFFVDYLFAYGFLGFGGIFRKTIKNQGLALSAGAVLVSALRYVCHFIAGVTIWKGYAPEGQGVFYYSLTYNASYMIPEAIITVIGALLISTVLDFSEPDLIRRKTQKN